MKIIYLLINRFSERDYKRFGFELLEKKGHDVEAWDCVDLLYPNLHGLGVNPNMPSFERNLKIFKNSSQLNDSIGRLSVNTLIVLLGTLNQNGFIHIIKKLNERKIKYGIVYLANLPNIQVSYLLKIFLYFKTPKILIDKIKSRLKTKDTINSTTEINPEFILYSGNVIKEKIDKIFSETKTKISVPSLDYDYYCEEDNHLEEKGSNYAVFVDEDNLDHPDIIYHNSKSNVNGRFYLNELNKYFEKFEHKTNLKILIAGHPKANYEKKENIFKGRDIIMNRTKELIKNSKAVLVHCSTSVSFAILARKPIIFLTSNKYTGEYQYLIEIMSRELGQRPTDISINNYDIRIPKLNLNFYKKYELNYLNNAKLNGNYSSIWETFNKYINSYSIDEDNEKRKITSDN